MVDNAITTEEIGADIWTVFVLDVANFMVQKKQIHALKVC
jgi:hypothetical protein